MDGRRVSAPRLIVAAVIAGLAVAGPAATAHAEGFRGDHNPSEYALELASMGILVTDESAYDIGHSICWSRLTWGESYLNLIDAISATGVHPAHGGGTGPLAKWVATNVVSNGEWHFCPQALLSD